MLNTCVGKIVWTVLPKYLLMNRTVDGELQTKPGVQWWLADYVDEFTGNVHLVRYELRHFFLVDGVPWEKFVNDEKWKKLPKGWTYNTNLLDGRVTVNPWIDLVLEKMKSMNYRSNDDLYKCIEKEWMVPASQNVYDIEVEIKDKQYRIIHNPNRNGLGRYPFTVNAAKKDVYDSYEGAMIAAEAQCAEIMLEQRMNLALDRIDTIDEIVHRMPAEHRDIARMILENIHWTFTTSIRYYDGKLLYSENKRLGTWVCLYDTKN